MGDKIWHQTVVIHGEAPLVSPHAESMFVQTLLERRKKGLRKCAMVLAVTDGKSMVRSQYGRCYEQCDITSAFFDDLQSANEWLEQN